MKNPLTTIAFGGLLVVIGLIAGFFAAGSGATAPSSPPETKEAKVLGPRTLGNLGVKEGVANLSTWVETVSVQAVVVDRPLNTRPVTAPLGGIVTSVEVRPGQTVRPGARLVSALREPIARPALALTADILTPVSHNLHGAVAAFRTARSQLTIAKAELARVKKFTVKDDDGDLPLLPRKVVIDLQYSIATAEQAAVNATRELERHGLEKAEIEAIAGGALPPGNLRLWRRALEINSLWGETEAAIHAALPERIRSLPWSVAAIGELCAAGLSTEELAHAIAETPAMATHFIEAASLVLQGHSVPEVRMLAERGALEPRMVLTAPGAGNRDWDVAQILVQPGQKVESGETLAHLHDARRMWLRLEPVGVEVRAVLAALESGAEVTASPLVADSGPELAGLRIDRMDTRGAIAARGAVAFVICENEPLPAAKGDARTWRIREGSRYLVRVPLRTFEKRFVLPAGAVTDRGPDKVVFKKDGKGFYAATVRVEHLDDRIAVIPNDGAIFAGDPIVTEGAFALGLALGTEDDEVDAHAGCNH